MSLTNLRLAARSLRRDPAYSVASVVTLGLGIGAVSAVFSLIYGILLSPLPYRDGDRLVMLRQHTADVENVPFSIPELSDYRERSRHLSLVEHHSMSFTLLGQGEPQRVSTGVVSHDFFDVLGVPPAVGRLFAPQDEGDGAPAVLVLSHGYWQRRFGADPAVVGRVFEMNNRPHTVIGVLPTIPQFPAEHDVYMPTSACPFRAAAQKTMHENRDAFRSLTVFGRLRPGAHFEQASQEIAGLARGFLDDHPETYGLNPGFSAEVAPLQSVLTRDARPMLTLLAAATLLVLLPACFNVANLTLARLLRRRRELAVRAALGADQRRLVGQVTLESALVALAGAAVGLIVAYGGLELLVRYASRFTPRAAGVEIDTHVLAFTCLLAMGTSLLFGALPTALGRVPVDMAVRDTGRSSEGRGGLRTRAGLVVLQVAASAVLLFGAGLLMRSFDALQKVDPGFNPERVVSGRVPLNWTRYPDRQSRTAFFERLLEELESRPAVLSAAVGSLTPLSQNGGNTQAFQIEGRPVEEALATTVDQQFVTPQLFSTLGIPLLQGREFDARDHEDGPAVAVVSRSFGSRHWPDGSPVGKRLSLDSGQSWVEIVGVVGDVRQYGLDREAADELYRPLAQTGMSNRVFVRARADTSALARVLEDAVLAVDPEQPVDLVEPLIETRDASIATPRTSAMLIGLFAGLALLITAAGVGSMTAWTVGRRTREIGIRMALGAGAPRVLSMVLSQILLWVLGGLALGLASTFTFIHLLAEHLYGVSVYDPWTLLAVATTLPSAALIACLYPAWRAVSVKPVVALRAE